MADAGGAVYGGSGWYQQLLAAIGDLVNAELSKQFATGYVTTPRNPAPTYEDALHAIWNNRPDLKTFYDKMWGKGNYEPYQAVKNWLQITTEESVIAAGRDPMAYAMDRGWVNPASEETTEKTVDREQMEANRALQYMNLMAQAKGPRDWVTYANLQRASSETGFPEWARALAQGLDLHPFQAGAVEGNQNLMSWLQLANPDGQPQGYTPEQAAATAGYGGGYLSQGSQGVPTSGYIQPHQVRPQQIMAMSPSEQEMLAGHVESQGGWWDDWIKKLQAAAPTGQAAGTSFFTGW